MKSPRCVPQSGCTFARVFLIYSACFVTVFGLLILLAPDKALKMISFFMFDSLEAPPPQLQLLGCLMLGWGAGKWTAILTGTDEAITLFCTLNLVPMTIMVMTTLPLEGKPWHGTMLALLLCYIVCAATGRRKERATTAWYVGRGFLIFSASVITVEGISMLVAPSWFLKTALFGDVDGKMALLLGSCALGWAIGKWSCLYNGDESIHLFCRLNLLPMIASIIVTMLQDDQNDSLVYVCFLIGYLFLALTGPPVTNDDIEAQLPRMLSQGRYGHMQSKHPDTSKLPYLPERRPSFKFMDNMLSDSRQGSKESQVSANSPLTQPLVADGALPERQTSSSSGKFATLSRVPSKEAAALSKQPVVQPQRPAFTMLTKA